MRIFRQRPPVNLATATRDDYEVTRKGTMNTTADIEAYYARQRAAYLAGQRPAVTPRLER